MIRGIPPQLKYVFRLEKNVSRAVDQNSLIPKGNNNMDFRIACDQVVLLETAANLWVSRRKANDLFEAFFFPSLESGGITKHLMTGPAENSEFCYSSGFASGNIEGLRETKLTVSLVASH